MDVFRVEGNCRVTETLHGWTRPAVDLSVAGAGGFVSGALGVALLAAAALLLAPGDARARGGMREDKLRRLRHLLGHVVPRRHLLRGDGHGQARAGQQRHHHRGDGIRAARPRHHGRSSPPVRVRHESRGRAARLAHRQVARRRPLPSRHRPSIPWRKGPRRRVCVAGGGHKVAGGVRPISGLTMATLCPCQSLVHEILCTRLLHKPKDPLLPRSSREQTPRKSVIPAKAGIHFNHENLWIPAFAGMTDGGALHDCRHSFPVIPAKAGSGEKAGIRRFGSGYAGLGAYGVAVVLRRSGRWYIAMRGILQCAARGGRRRRSRR